MAAKVGFLLYCIAMFMLLTATESQANYYSPGTAAQHAGGHSPAPAPAPQATKFPMHGSTPGSLQPQECLGRCTTRCSATAYKKPCMFFCQKCCATCLCVPPGTYGNKEFCPCYNNWKTKRGGPKCP